MFPLLRWDGSARNKFEQVELQIASVLEFVHLVSELFVACCYHKFVVGFHTGSAGMSQQNEHKVGGDTGEQDGTGAPQPQHETPNVIPIKVDRKAMDYLCHKVSLPLWLTFVIVILLFVSGVLLFNYYELRKAEIALEAAKADAAKELARKETDAAKELARKEVVAAKELFEAKADAAKELFEAKAKAAKELFEAKAGDANKIAEEQKYRGIGYYTQSLGEWFWEKDVKVNVPIRNTGEDHRQRD